MSLSRETLIAKSLVEARGKAVFFTGAGISTESGLPDFRGKHGLWTKIDPEIFSLDYFTSQPHISWKDYIERIYFPILRAEPNDAHFSVSKLESMDLVEAVITQNIDRLHWKAGSKNVIELHGRFDEFECVNCGFRGKIDQNIVQIVVDGRVPICPKCGSLLKPAVVYFGEPLPREALDEAFRLASSCRVMIVVGSSLSVFPAALIPRKAVERGAELFIINESPTPLDPFASIVIREKASRALRRVVEALKTIEKD